MWKPYFSAFHNQVKHDARSHHRNHLPRQEIKAKLSNQIILVPGIIRGNIRISNSKSQSMVILLENCRCMYSCKKKH